MTDQIAANVAKALDHLHEHDRIHADLKPLNIMSVGTTWRLIDLGRRCTNGCLRSTRAAAA